MALVKSFNSKNLPFSRKGMHFGERSPSDNTYIKLRFQDERDVPETWFKLRQLDNDVLVFESDDIPWVIACTNRSTSLIILHQNDLRKVINILNNEDTGVAGMLDIRRRKDSTPEYPRWVLVGEFNDHSVGSRALIGSMVGAKSHAILSDMTELSHTKVEMVGGMELSFS